MEEKGAEKKVEYIELIYDLIFVYIVGRNNSLLHHFSNGFVEPSSFLTYILMTLAVIQIWNYSTYYINIYGRHSVREHVFLFVNMFLLYFIGEGTRADWQGYYTQYHVAWALILVNVGVQYLFELRGRTEPRERSKLLRMAGILFGQAAVVAADIWVFRATGKTWLSLFAILGGMVLVAIYGRRRSEGNVDFMHLSERAMLYVVFTFGEMVICIATYFEGAFSWRNTYFALMAFLIVAGLFLSYGYFYDHIIDREKQTNGLAYMFLHIFLIFALNNITNGLEFMREDEVALLPKLFFLVFSFLLFFGVLFALGLGHAKKECRRLGRLAAFTGVMGLVFAALMYIFQRNMMVNIALTVVFVFIIFAVIFRYGRQMEAGGRI